MNTTIVKSCFHLLHVSVLLILGLALLSTAAFGQGNASIVGTVTDPMGAVVPNAKITITNTDTGIVRIVTTNGTGNYLAADLNNGRYTVKAEAQGFKALEKKNITVDVNQVVRIDEALQVGSVGQSVTVEANAIQVQADTSDVSQTITSEQITNLATNGRNILQLTALVPGASSQMPDFDKPGAQFQNHSIQFDGMRADGNNWVIDGGEAYDRGGGGILIVSPSQDALTEFTITTSNYAADLGNSSGGMVTMAVKSGTRRFHASAWEYDRNDDLDAYSWTAKQATKPLKAELRYNAFGFNVGGPVELKSSKPKTFFFYNQEWRREISGGSINNQVPSTANYSGDFSSTTDNMSSMKVYVPEVTNSTLLAKYSAYGLVPGQQFQYNGTKNVIPPGLIDSTATAWIKAVTKAPNSSDGKYFISGANTADYWHEEIGRVDHQVNDKIAVFGHLIWDSLSEKAPVVSWTSNTYPTIGSLETVPSWAGVLHLTYNIKPNLLEEVAFNTNGNDITIANTGAFKTPSGFSTSPYYPTVNPNGKLPQMSISTPYGSVAMDTGSWPWQNWWRSYQWKDDLSWSHGAHNMKFGFAWLYATKKQQIFKNVGGSYTFNGTATQCGADCVALYGSNVTSGSGGIGLADFLLGNASNFNQTELQDAMDIGFNSIDAYFNDDFRVSHRLTLNIGMRWEATPHAYDLHNRASNFYPYAWDPTQKAVFVSQSTSSGSNALDTTQGDFVYVPGVALSNVLFFMDGIGLAGRNGVPRGMVTRHWGGFAPRLGFDYDLFGAQKTVLRGGLGVFYERNAGNEEYNMGGNAPFVNSTSMNTVMMDTPTINYKSGTGAAATPTTPQGLTGLQANLPITAVYQFNLGIQHQLRNNMVATLSYVGNHSSHLSYTSDINTLYLGDKTNRTHLCGSACSVSGSYSADWYRPYTGFQGITMIEDGGNAHYGSMQATIRASSWHGLNVSAAYTWGHSWDQVDAQIWNNISNPFNPKYDDGTANFDRRQIVVASFDYTLPVFQHSQGLTKTVLGGWTISGITSMETGNPITISAAGDNIFIGGNTASRANQTGKVHYPKKASKWFDDSVFTQPALFNWGTGGKSAVVGPGRNNWNLTLSKDFHFNENTGFQFKAESFNTWNHTQYTTVNTSVLNSVSGTSYNSGAGQITNAADPRIFQLGAKIYF